MVQLRANSIAKMHKFINCKYPLTIYIKLQRTFYRSDSLANKHAG